jgi:WD40 repeat protein
LRDDITATTLSGGDDVLATAGHDSAVRLWNPHTGHPISQPLTGHTARSGR